MKDYDVIISGAGPVGLFLACELALAGCSVLIIERAESPHSPLKQLPFGIRGLSAPTIESLYRRGLLDELTIHKELKNPHQFAKQGGRRQVGHFAGIPFHEGDVDTARWKHRLASSPDSSLISEMRELETVLTRRAEALGVEIRRGMATTGFHQAADEVTVQTGREVFTGRWLVGCDGSRSVVRKAGGFEFAGTEPAFTGYTAQVDLADGEKLRPGRNVTSRGMYMVSQPGYITIQDFDVADDIAPELLLEIDAIKRAEAEEEEESKVSGKQKATASSQKITSNAKKSSGGTVGNGRKLGKSAVSKAATKKTVKKAVKKASKKTAKKAVVKKSAPKKSAKKSQVKKAAAKKVMKKAAPKKVAKKSSPKKAAKKVVKKMIKKTSKTVATKKKKR